MSYVAQADSSIERFARYCPICCQGHDAFRAAGDPPRTDEKCPSCGSRARHRLIWLFLNRETDLFSGRRLRFLHIAPEKSLGPSIASAPNLEYVSGDLEPGRAMIELDVTKIQFPDKSFDAIYCSHVLEHVPDDRTAMREFYRVLKPGRWAILQVPICGERTFEDPSVVDPEERKRLFGQHDHVRRYGADYFQRLKEAGFTARKIAYARRLGEWTIRKMGLRTTGKIHFCQKLSA